MPDIIGRDEEVPTDASTDSTLGVGIDSAATFDAQSRGGQSLPGAEPGLPPAHLAILSVVSLGLYEFYWIWRGWTALRDETGADINPRWRTAAFLVPFANVLVLYFLMRDTKELAESRGVAADYSPGLLTALFFSLRLIGNAALIGGAAFGWAAGFATVLPLLPVQYVWNAYWTKQRPGGHAIRTAINPTELAVAVLAGLMVMLVASLFAATDNGMSPPG
jgi:hypothetical protein